jgi:hypothetical protein
MADNRCQPSENDVKKRVITAICTLYGHDGELLDLDASERSLTHRLAIYLAAEFPGWHVDCEYNRRGREIKRLRVDSDYWNLRADDTEAKTVFPDIVIHKRMTNENLIVIEAKKATGPDDTKDKEKLRAFTEEQDYRYEYGLLLKLATDGSCELKLYQDGAYRSNWTKSLRSALKELGYGG